MSSTITVAPSVSHASIVARGRGAANARIDMLEQALRAAPAETAGLPRVRGRTRQLVRLYCARADLNSRGVK